MSEELSANEYRAQRIENRDKLAAAGYTPYGGAFQRTDRLDRLHEQFELDAPVKACGRIVAMRKMGKLAFAHIHDGSAKFQLMIQKNEVGEEAFAAFRLLDLGDIIGVEGVYFLTKTEEQTIALKAWSLLSKSLLPLPEKFHGLADVETRYRQRSLDLISNDEVMRRFKERTQVLREIRRYLDKRDFLEVETPMLQQIPGGAAAKPFMAHYNALDTDVFMRIAPELYLKRLIVGGMDRVYELNRNFRNEGIDRTHNPEFTCLEIYQAYGDMRSMQELIQGLFAHVAETVYGKMEFEWMGHTINLKGPWREVAYEDLIKEALGENWFEQDVDQVRSRARELQVSIDEQMCHEEITHEIYDKTIESTLIQPTFITRLPAHLVPLANACADDARYVDVFELIIGGKEIAPAYSELNDPIEQRKRFEEQAEGDREKIDQDFLTALEIGMPPTGGMGIGIDRLIMLLSGADAIRDVILFPQLKPRG